MDYPLWSSLKTTAITIMFYAYWCLLFLGRPIQMRAAAGSKVLDRIEREQ